MTTKRERMYSRIAQHGQNLLTIFPDATERDPVKLCKRLRTLESQASRIGLQLCNGPEFATEDEPDRLCESILDRLDKLIGFRASGVPVFVNRDPRGYALKIDDSHVRSHNLKIDKDWGGYGLLAPDFSNE